MLQNGVINSRSVAPKQEPLEQSTSTKHMVQFGLNIKAERCRQGLSRERLAEYANTSIDTIKRFENGEGIRLDIAFNIADALHVSLQSLLPQEERTVEQIIREIISLCFAALKYHSTEE